MSTNSELPSEGEIIANLKAIRALDWRKPEPFTHLRALYDLLPAENRPPRNDADGVAHAFIVLLGNLVDAVDEDEEKHPPDRGHSIAYAAMLLLRLEPPFVGDGVMDIYRTIAFAWRVKPDYFRVHLQKDVYRELAERLLRARLSDSDPEPSREAGRVLLVGRRVLNRYHPAPDDQLRNAEKEVFISGIDCADVAVPTSRALKESLKRGVKVKFICLSPKATPFIEQLPHLDRFNAPAVFLDAMVNTESQLQALQQHGPLEYRLLPYLPSIHFFVVDPDLPTCTFKLEVYTPLGNKSGLGRPHIIIGPDMQTWREQLMTVWWHYWATAEKPEIT